MSEKEKSILEGIAKNIKQMSEGGKQYVLGYSEGMAQAREEQRKEESDEENRGV